MCKISDQLGFPYLLKISLVFVHWLIIHVTTYSPFGAPKASVSAHPIAVSINETHPVSECLSTKNINQINMCIYISYLNPSFLNICCTKFRCFFRWNNRFGVVFFRSVEIDSYGTVTFWASTQQLPGFDAFFGNGTKALAAWQFDGQVCSNLLAIMDVDHQKMRLILQCLWYYRNI